MLLDYHVVNDSCTRMPYLSYILYSPFPSYPSCSVASPVKIEQFEKYFEYLLIWDLFILVGLTSLDSETHRSRNSRPCIEAKK